MSTDYSQINPLDCTGDASVCPVEASIYGYKPNRPSTAFFLAIFAICGIANVYLGIRYKTWTYMVALGLGCFTMTLGYAGRMVLSNNAFDLIGFQIQICCLTLAPAFNSAAVYLILKHLVRVFGREYSRIRPKFYTWIFITADICALVLQGAGGGIASTAGDDEGFRAVGDGLMMAGIAWQVATLGLFMLTALDFAIRRYRAPSKSPLSSQAVQIQADLIFKAFMVAVLLAYITILIRCVYRIVEMSGGWGNEVMQNEILFIVLESMMLSIATIAQTVCHPGFCFSAMSRTSIKMSKELASSDKELSEEETGNEPKHAQV